MNVDGVYDRTGFDSLVSAADLADYFLEVIIPHHETFSTTTQPPYSSTKG